MSVRLSTALAAGAVALPEGRVLLMRPPADLDLDGLGPDRLHAVHGFRPAHDALTARGLSVAPRLEVEVEGAVVFVSRSKAQTRDMIAQACAAVPAGGPVVVDGAKADGVESILRDCRRAFTVGEVFAKAHGKCFAFPAQPAPGDWHDLPRHVAGFVTRAGVFSADGVDPGSALLARHLRDLDGTVCDLGAGWGYLARAVLASDRVTAVALVEAERDALDCARENIADARAAYHWADATIWRGGPFDTVISNPPFHTSRKADPELGRAFVRAAADLTAPRGRFVLVANRHLPYEATLAEVFAQVVVLADEAGYKVIDARRPKRRRT
ncbi:methyltransferase [Jannaschia sp. S6380]|uniref:methyltransferase n=1 Tax=Jannaschia sp. S6380 TaxID=2926408 RepID=UPI001FF11F69|nr:methyltransferase [Jannaschia sp. S6380]MCK0167815.1 methyltransferase [Jannaschia sp. S6380]